MGVAEAVGKMAFGNKLGVQIEHNVDRPLTSSHRAGQYRLRGARRQRWASSPSPTP